MKSTSIGKFYRIEMLKAGTGDCFWIECGENARKVFRIVIDGGDDNDTIIQRLKQTTTGNSPIDLWIITHTDQDHIKGVLNLKSYGDVREVWFNAPASGASAVDPTLSYGQGNKLLSILKKRPETLWNKTCFDGGPVQTRLSDEPPVLLLPNGRLKLLGPTPEVVAELFQEWLSTTLGDHDDEIIPIPRPVPDDVMVDRLAAEPDSRPDTAITNRSSIIVAIEFDIEGRDEPARFLFAGDAPPPAVLDVVHKLKGKSERLKLDGFKLCHHGSVRSISRALLEALDCPDYYISTSGLKYDLPNDPAIAKAIVHGGARRLFFNYEHIGRRWLDYKTGSKRELDVLFPEDGLDHVVVAEHKSETTVAEVWYEEVPRPCAPSVKPIKIVIGPAKGALKIVLRAPPDTKLVWTVAPSAVESIRKVSADIRRAMDVLATTWPDRDRFDIVLASIATQGQALFRYLFGPKPEAFKLLTNAAPKTSIVVRCHRELSVPFGLIHPPSVDPNPRGFWAYQYSISSPFDESAPTAAMVLELLSFIGAPECNSPPPEFGAYHEEWKTLNPAWRSMAHCLNHFYCHNEGRVELSTRSGATRLTAHHIFSIANDRIDDSKGPDVLFLNACDTRELRLSSDWESVLTHKPFYGFIGTEALVHYQAALQFAIVFFRQLSAGADLYEAFDKTVHLMWPASLFYGMYLQPDFARATKLAPAGERK